MEVGLFTASLEQLPWGTTASVEQVGYVDFRNENKLAISQRGVVLGEQHLQLASSKRANKIGGHGEGFKVGINLLLRSNFQATYAMSGKVWTFYLRKTCPGAGFRNLVVVEETGPAREDLFITIQGSGGARDLFQPDVDLRLVPVLQRQCDCKNGSLYYHPDSRYHGKVYVRGLFVAEDEHFRRLQLVVNLHTHVVRDRHELPSNTWQLIGNMLTELADGHQQHVALFDHLIEIYQKNSVELMAKSLAHTKEPIRRFIGRVSIVDKDKVVFLRAVDQLGPVEMQGSKEAQLPKALDRFVLPNAGALADPVDVRALKNEYAIKKRPVRERELNSAERGSLGLWEKILETWKLNCAPIKSKKPKHSVKELPLARDRNPMPFTTVEQEFYCHNHYSTLVSI
jgi:hypothetical protein